MEPTVTTVKALAEELGVCERTIRRKKKQYEELGYKFVGSRAPKKPVEYTPEKLINTYYDILDYPRPFTGGMYYTMTKESAVKNLKRFEKDLSGYARAMYMHIMLQEKYFKNYYVLSEDKVAIINTFSSICGFDPTTEQLKLINTILRFFMDTTGYSKGVVQADAGSSKTTCLKTILALLEANGVAHTVISKTNRAVAGAGGDHSIAKEVNELLGVNTVGMDAQQLYSLISMYELTAERLDEVLIVDEYSMLSPYDYKVLAATYKKILFVGDTMQIGETKFYPGILLGTLRHQYRFDGAEDDTAVRATGYVRKKNFAKLDKMLKEKAEETLTSCLEAEEGENKSVVLKRRYSEAFKKRRVVELLKQFTGDNKQIVSYSKDVCHCANLLLNGGRSIKEGSKVVLKKKDYTKQDQVTGTFWRVLEVIDGVAYCSSLDGFIGVCSFKVEALELAYAVTTIIAQGSSWEYVLAITSTANTANQHNDTYVLVTRASKKTTIINHTGTDTDVEKFFSVLFAREGGRYYSTADSARELVKQAKKKGLSEEEVLRAVQYGTSNTTKVVHKVTKELPKEFVENKYGLVLKKRGELVYPTKFTLTKERAEQAVRPGAFITESLKGGNRVVIDCDSKEMFDVFIKYAPNTEAYIGEGKLHLVYTVDKFYKTSVDHKLGLDFLGNDPFRRRLRNVKPNKAWNGVEALALPQQVIEELLALGVELKAL